MKLTNEELVTVATANVSQQVKEHICKQKMAPEEVAVCKQTGVSLVDFMILKSTEA